MPMFAKRHYEEIARLLNGKKPVPAGSADTLDCQIGFKLYERDLQYWHGLVDGFVTLFKADNPNFRPGSFREACELGHTSGMRRNARV